MAYYFIAKFDTETQRRMSGYYDCLRMEGLIGQQTKGVPYHFTLGEHSKDADEAALIAQLEEICAKTPRVEFCMGHMGMFDLRVLFLAPNMNFELLQLRQSFFPGSGSGAHPWAAHATVLLDAAENIQRAIPLLADRFEPFRARVDSVALWEFFPTRLIKECYLQGEPSSTG